MLPQFLAEMEIVFLLHIMMQEPVSEKAFVDFVEIRAEAGSKNILVLSEHNMNLTTEGIAYLLGYKELNSFRKAFTSWTGLKVSEYRKTIKNH